MKAILINLTSVCTKRQTNRVGKRKESYMKKYVAIYHNCAVRDAQICKVNQDTVPGEPWDDEYWQDLEDAEVFIGILTAETELDATRQAMEQEGCDESAIQLIEVGGQDSTPNEEDVINVVQQFYKSYSRDEKAKGLILDICSELLNVSVDTLLELIDRS